MSSPSPVEINLIFYLPPCPTFLIQSMYWELPFTNDKKPQCFQAASASLLSKSLSYMIIKPENLSNGDERGWGLTWEIWRKKQYFRLLSCHSEISAFILDSSCGKLATWNNQLDCLTQIKYEEQMPLSLVQPRGRFSRVHPPLHLFPGPVSSSRPYKGSL